MIAQWITVSVAILGSLITVITAVVKITAAFSEVRATTNEFKETVKELRDTIEAFKQNSSETHKEFYDRIEKHDIVLVRHEEKIKKLEEVYLHEH